MKKIKNKTTAELRGFQLKHCFVFFSLTQKNLNQVNQKFKSVLREQQVLQQTRL